MATLNPFWLFCLSCWAGDNSNCQWVVSDVPVWKGLSTRLIYLRTGSDKPWKANRPASSGNNRYPGSGAKKDLDPSGRQCLRWLEVKEAATNPQRGCDGFSTYRTALRLCTAIKIADICAINTAQLTRHSRRAEDLSAQANTFADVSPPTKAQPVRNSGPAEKTKGQATTLAAISATNSEMQLVRTSGGIEKSSGQAST